MSRVLVCTEYDTVANTCTTQAWLEQPGFLPPLSADEGLTLSTYMLGPLALAWMWKAIRRYLNPKMG